jgi:hypothetical protein
MLPEALAAAQSSGRSPASCRQRVFAGRNSPRGRAAALAALLVFTCAAALSVRPGLTASQNTSADATPEARAVRFLSAEVPRWRREHPCYSCHNNGDAARALIAAAARGLAVGAALDDTLTWLGRPERWDENAQGGGLDDKPLARIQFAAALTSAVENGRASRDALVTAAAMLEKDQSGDGSWRLDSSQSVGSPATYGTVLATWSARRTLLAAASPAMAPAIARADAWLRAFDAKNMLDSAAVVLALARATDDAGRLARGRAAALLAKGQAPDGGWGLYATSASEPFDTAAALLALAALAGSDGTGPETIEARAAIARGRRFLIDRQLPDGSWPETTRPSGQESYAQRISTAGWATLALIETGNW